MPILKRQSLYGLIDLAVYNALRLMPIPIASGVGALWGRVSGRYLHAAQTARANDNLARLRPELSAAERRTLIGSMCSHLGRIVTEFACLQRLRRSDRITLVDAECLPAPGKPVIIAASHTGSWEALAIGVVMLGHSTSSIYHPQSSSVRNAIASRERQALGWIGIEADRSAVRRAIGHLKHGGALVIYVDECLAGHVKAPKLGRDIPLDGNISLAARLARSQNVPLVFGRCERTEGARYTVSFEPVPTAGADEAATVSALDTLLEAAVRAHPEQWLMLHLLDF